MALDIRQHIEDWVKELEAEVGTVKTEIVEHVRQFGDWFSNKHQYGIVESPAPGDVEDEVKHLVAVEPDMALEAHAALTTALTEAGHLSTSIPPGPTAVEFVAADPEAALASHEALTVALTEAGHLPPQALTPPPVEDKATADTTTEIKTNEGPEEHHDLGAP